MSLKLGREGRGWNAKLREDYRDLGPACNQHGSRSSAKTRACCELQSDVRFLARVCVRRHAGCA